MNAQHKNAERIQINFQYFRVVLNPFRGKMLWPSCRAQLSSDEQFEKPPASWSQCNYKATSAFMLIYAEHTLVIFLQGIAERLQNGRKKCEDIQSNIAALKKTTSKKGAGQFEKENKQLVADLDQTEELISK